MFSLNGKIGWTFCTITRPKSKKFFLGMQASSVISFAAPVSAAVIYFRALAEPDLNR
jgi:hypothetical protein